MVYLLWDEIIKTYRCAYCTVWQARDVTTNSKHMTAIHYLQQYSYYTHTSWTLTAMLPATKCDVSTEIGARAHHYLTTLAFSHTYFWNTNVSVKRVLFFSDLPHLPFCPSYVLWNGTVTHKSATKTSPTSHWCKLISHLANLTNSAEHSLSSAAVSRSASQVIFISFFTGACH
jgi:hypothetical protein